MIRRTFIASTAALLLVACSDQGPRYAVPIAEAQKTLLATGLPPTVFGTEPPEAEMQANGASEVIWIASQNDAELFRFVAHLTDDGGKATRVKVEMKGGNGDIAKRLEANPKIRDMYIVAMNEQVASALEHRPFQISAVYPAMTAATMANMGKLQASADEAAAASEKEARDNMAKAYADEAAGRR